MDVIILRRLTGLYAPRRLTAVGHTAGTLCEIWVEISQK
jgi:hypothetical protein